MKIQYKAGYISDIIGDSITLFKKGLNNESLQDREKAGKINGLLQHISSFDVTYPYQFRQDHTQLQPVLATLNNIITRGLPTKAPVILEELFAILGLTQNSTRNGTIRYSTAGSGLTYEEIFELIHIIEPGLSISRQNYGGRPGSSLEWEFIRKHPFLIQILESQRDFSTINHRLPGNRTVDFCFTSPYLKYKTSGQDYERIGRIFEVDGPHHYLSEYRFYDLYRDQLAADSNFETFRQTAADIRSDNTKFEELIGRSIYQIFKKNYEKDIHKHLPAYSLIFIPLAVARIQKTILELFLSDTTFLQKEHLNIAIIERDLPCGAIAIASLQELFHHINTLLEEKERLPLPTIRLTIFPNPTWVFDEHLHLQANLEDEAYFKLNNFDIILDHAIMRRSDVYKEIDFLHEGAIKIRSSHYYDTSFGSNRRTYCATLLNYQPLVLKRDNGTYAPISALEENINFFIQNIFRKTCFREGQLPIISRVLRQLPVIGLLPTGGGKSLTFQLPAFLQPGICLVVDPIKSLMEDQVRVMKTNWIDCCDYVNSNLESGQKRKRLINLQYGESQFLFVSPERFVMEEFRDIIQHIDQSIFGLAFSYCVIDEVHCVSEWGHDFRSTYLMLGKNAQRFAKTRSGNPVSLAGLTATASFDVLADIERELGIKHHDVADAIVMIENTIRPELFFRVIDVTKDDRMSVLNKELKHIGRNLAKINTDAVLRKSQEHHFNEFEKRDFATPETKDKDESLIEFKYDPSLLIEEDISGYSASDTYGIIFCPVKGRSRNSAGLPGNTTGVDYVYLHLALPPGRKGYYYSNDTSDGDEPVNEKEILSHFNDFVDDKLNFMVCTKAFGMGIDKPDIRSTYHYYYAGSLESLVQEAGRSGRDKKISEAVILISRKKYFKLNVDGLFNVQSNHPAIKNKNNRRIIRNTFERRWVARRPEEIVFSSEENVLQEIELLENQDIKTLLQEKDEKGNYLFIKEYNEDRDTHNFFYNMSFKGISREQCQVLNLFKIREFQLINGERINIHEQDTLENTFNQCTDKSFKFLITSTKRYEDPASKIQEVLGLQPNVNTETLIAKLYKYASSFQDFLFSLEERNVFQLENLTSDMKESLKFIYGRDRGTPNDTGKLIYRMHSIGFLEDYVIDYNRGNLYICTFRKYESIKDYISFIESYLRRFLSENAALNAIHALNKRLTKPTVIGNVIECLYYLAEFSHEEIASKRRRATSEIENILNESVTIPEYIGPENWYKQNEFLKEQIYFYFNAKYARIGFKINNQPYSLLDDYKDSTIERDFVLNKYLEILTLDRTAQNNYKHMIGSCKKIMRSLADTDMNKDWVLRLIRAFVLYSVNNPSYRPEANSTLIAGLDNLYQDEPFHKYNFNTLENIIRNYFTKLKTNLQADNVSFKHINTIFLNQLLSLQNRKLEKILNNHQSIILTPNV